MDEHVREHRHDDDSITLVDSVTSTRASTPVVERREGQRPSREIPVTLWTDMGHNELLGVGAQFDGIGLTRENIGIVQAEQVALCSHHGRVLCRTQDDRVRQALSPSDRYLAEGPLERYAILHPHWAETLAPTEVCRCREILWRHGIDINALLLVRG